MTDREDFNFGDEAVAATYDRGLVPVLFNPWAAKLVEDNGPWDGMRVLDLATGTGAVAAHLAGCVGPTGRVFATDINPEMLALAKGTCSGKSPPVEFMVCPAHLLGFSDDSLDRVVCQQGFQFFQDRLASAREIYRVLRNRGLVIATTWRPVEECPFFGMICAALERIGEPNISAIMRIPFDFMPELELVSNFEKAGFYDVKIEHHELDMVMDGGISHAIETAFSTPIKPRLRTLTQEKQTRFQDELAELLIAITDNGKTTSRMVSTVLIAKKQN